MNKQTMIARDNIGSLVLPVEPIDTLTTIAEVADIFLSEGCRDLLCLPIVVEQHIVGTISRYAIMRIFLQKFGREIFGRRTALGFMNSTPLVVPHNVDLTKASSYVRDNITQPLTDDFVITKDGKYLGMGQVLSLLELMEQQTARRGKALAQANQHLKRSQARLVQSEKMASLGQMVAGVAHEINTPLGYVRSNLEMAQEITEQLINGIQSGNNLCRALLDGDTSDEDIGGQLQKAAQETGTLVDNDISKDVYQIFNDSLHGLEQISELVINLKNFSRLDRARIGKININDCLESALSIGRGIIKSKAEVTLDLADDVTAECAPSQINQVLLNILTNAAQAMPDFGRIDILTRSSNKKVAIAIRDNGKGIPEKVKSRIFDPFFTTKPVGEGTGLGLSISYQIIRQHGGTIEVNSRPGKGTEFIIRLPRVQSSATENRSEPQGATA